MKKTSRAFSLMELSIVILIIGIIVAGVTQGSRLVAQSKLSSARTLTQSSPVASIRGLSLWLEPTLETSFSDADATDGTTISVWNDINPQQPKLFARSTTTATSLISYKAVSTINGLPSVSFAGTTAGNYFTLSTTQTSTTATPIVTADNAFTIFLVYQTDPSITNAGASSNDKFSRSVFFNGTNGTDGYGFMRNGVGGLTTTNPVGAGVGKRYLNSQNANLTGSSVNSGFINSTPEVLSATFGGNSDGNLKMYMNGTLDASATSISMVTPTTALYIGDFLSSTSSPVFQRPWKGFISEIIIFDTALRNSDRQEVEKYLMKKYGIR